MQHLQPNTTLQGGKYRIERVLGQGGFGITYLARNTVFDIDVAIKEFFMKDENDRDGSSVTMPNTTKQELFHGQMEKFKKEAKRMFAIKNEHIVGVQDLFEENGTAYYVMDFVDGENLAERLKRTGKPMSEQEVRDILPQILDALKSIHDAGIWHLDLKPANILIDKSGYVKLIDFGASKQLNAQKGGATTCTAISYTNGYAPREQMEQNYDKFGPWTDIYALGATLYNLLTSKRPPLPTDIDDDSSEDKHNALPFPKSVGEIRFLVLQMMKTNRLQRPQSIDTIIHSEKNREVNLNDFSEIEPFSYLKDNEDEVTIVAKQNIPCEGKKSKSESNVKLFLYISTFMMILGALFIFSFSSANKHMLFMGARIDGSCEEYLKSIAESTFHDDIFDCLGMKLYKVSDNNFEAIIQGDKSQTITFTPTTIYKYNGNISHVVGSYYIDSISYEYIFNSLQQRLGKPKYDNYNLSDADLENLYGTNKLEWFLVKDFVNEHSFSCWEQPLGYIITFSDTSAKIGSIFIIDKSNMYKDLKIGGKII